MKASACATFAVLFVAAAITEGFVASSPHMLRWERRQQASRLQKNRAFRGGNMLTMAVSHAAAEETENADEIPTLKDAVSVSSFEALDVRAGRIVLAESIPDPDHDNKPSRKYLSLVVDLGNEKRRVVSAVRSIIDVEDAIGKQVLMVANVEEETILGRPSRGRLLSASNFRKAPMPRTLRTILLGPGGVPPGSAVSGL